MEGEEGEQRVGLHAAPLCMCTCVRMCVCICARVYVHTHACVCLCACVPVLAPGTVVYLVSSRLQIILWLYSCVFLEEILGMLGCGHRYQPRNEQATRASVCDVGPWSGGLKTYPNSWSVIGETVTLLRFM